MKRILSLLISFGCLVVALAQSSTMNVFMRNGERFVFNTDSISIITFGEGDTIENEHSFKMMYGLIEDGYPIKGKAEERWRWSYSRLFANDGELVFMDIDDNTSFICYDNDFNCISSCTKDVETIKSAKYLRIINGGENRTKAASEIKIIYKNCSGHISFVKEPYLETKKIQWFTCNVTTYDDKLSDENEKRYTNAWLTLPPDYLQDGDKTKLIVLCTGTTGAPFDKIKETIISKTDFLNAMGYATLVVNACSDKYKESVRTNAATPLGVSCFESAIHYVLDNYNIDDRIYLLAKSAGGITAMNLINMTSLNIKAAALQSPNLDAFNDFRCSPTYVSQYYFIQFGLPYFSSWSKENLSLMKERQNVFDGYNPMTYNSTIDIKEYNDLVLDNDYPLSSSSYPDYRPFNMESYSNNLLLGEKMQSLVGNAKLFLKVPIKIWYVEDDEQVPFGTIVNFAKMAANAGRECILRKMPKGTGHDCADCESFSKSRTKETLFTTIHTKLGGYMEVALGNVEAIQWLENFQ